METSTSCGLARCSPFEFSRRNKKLLPLKVSDEFEVTAASERERDFKTCDASRERRRRREAMICVNVACLRNIPQSGLCCGLTNADVARAMAPLRRCKVSADGHCVRASAREEEMVRGEKRLDEKQAESSCAMASEKVCSASQRRLRCTDGT